MALWICTDCGCAEELSFYPDCCSHCRGNMETQDGRNTAGSYDESAHYERISEMYDDLGAEQGDEASIIRLWQRGRALPAHQQRVVDDARLSNSIALLAAIYDGAAA